jgi:mRNA-degrading endonuclease toxin of MazEF toxin-antitoxin module
VNIAALSQGQFWWAELPRPIGSAPGSRRPVLVVQGNDFNRSSITTVVVVPLTSNLRLAQMPNWCSAASTSCSVGSLEGIRSHGRLATTVSELKNQHRCSVKKQASVETVGLVAEPVSACVLARLYAARGVVQANAPSSVPARLMAFGPHTLRGWRPRQSTALRADLQSLRSLRPLRGDRLTPLARREVRHEGKLHGSFHRRRRRGGQG